MYLISFFLIYIGLFFIYPSFILDIIASVLTIPIYYMKLYRYNDINSNIKSVFAEKSDKEVLNINYNSTKITILNFLIGLFGKILYKFTLHVNSIEIDIPKNLKADIKDNGIILVGSHFGTFYNPAIYLGKLLNEEISMVYKSQKFINNILYPKNYYKKINFIKVIKGDTLSKLKKIEKDIVAIGCDQRPSTNSKSKILVKFLKHEVDFHLGPALLLKDTNRKLWEIKSFYKNYKTYITFTKLEDKVNNRNNLNETTQIIADKFTENIFANPEQYLWFHRRFKLIQNIG